MADRTRSGQVSRRQVDLATRRAGTGPALRARQLRIGNPILRGLARASGIQTRDQAWRIGAAGEVKVGARLDRLRRHGWRVLHSISLGRGGDIDHLIIGPAGVFTANTKHHPNAATWWLRIPGQRPGRRGNADVEALYAAARDPVTWRRT